MQLFKKRYIIIILILLVPALLLYFFGGALKGIKNKIKAIFENRSVKGAEVKTNDNYGNPIVINLQLIATGIYDAFYGNMFGMVEDEDTAIQLLLNVPKSEIPALNRYYSAINNKGKSIYVDFRKFLSNTDFKKVSHLVG